MAINSRAKGKRSELALAKLLRETYGFENARRSAQYCGANGDADIVGAFEGFHLEAKNVQRLNLEAAYEQSKSDAAAESERKGHYIVPIVVHKKDRKPWMVTMSLDDFIKMYRSAME